MINDAKEAVENGKLCNGVKGMSETAIVDLVNGIPIDYMHCVLEGVTKWLLQIWVKTYS